MVDVGEKPATDRAARARGAAVMSAEALAAVRSNAVKKGDVLGVARIAGIMAAKRTADLVPLCHQLPLAQVHVDLALDDALRACASRPRRARARAPGSRWRRSSR
jgi:cyclic pyranopterin phosphate synthase